MRASSDAAALRIWAPRLRLTREMPAGRFSLLRADFPASDTALAPSFPRGMKISAFAVGHMRRPAARRRQGSRDARPFRRAGS